MHAWLDRRLRRYIKIDLISILDSELTLYAASLSFYTIFAIIPLLLIILSIATNIPSFGDDYEALKGMILENLMPAYTQRVSAFLDTFFQNSLKLGVMGVIYVIVTSLMFFKNYEHIVSRIFNSKPRGFWDSIATYWTLVTLLPIGLITSIYITGQLQSALSAHAYTAWIDILSILPYLITWAMFFIVYKISDSSIVHNRAALISSLIISLIWSLSKNIYVYYVLNNSSYETIYGSFSIVLFFFLWVYFSWIIILYGMKICVQIEAIIREQERE